MKRKINIVISAALMSGFVSTSTLAEVYIGGKLGWNDLNHACESNTPCDDDSFATGLFLGYDLNEFFALEYSADYLGDVKGNYAGKNFQGELAALTLAPKISLPVSQQLSLFAKAGGAYMMLDDHDDIVWAGSLGTEYAVNYNWAVRAEYQRFENMNGGSIKDLDANVYSVGVKYTFGSPKPLLVEKVIEVTEMRPVMQIQQMTSPEQIATVYFPTNSVKFGDGSQLDNAVNVLTTYPQAQVSVLGFTDATGSEEYNQEFSILRAQSVAAYLEEKGVDASRMTLEGFGEDQPAATNITAEGRKLNRRVDVVIPAFNYSSEVEIIQEMTTQVVVLEEVSE